MNIDLLCLNFFTELSSFSSLFTGTFPEGGLIPLPKDLNAWRGVQVTQFSQTKNNLFSVLVAAPKPSIPPQKNSCGRACLFNLYWNGMGENSQSVWNEHFSQWMNEKNDDIIVHRHCFNYSPRSNCFFSLYPVDWTGITWKK